MEVNNKLATIIIGATIVILAFVVIFVTKIILSAEPKEQEINKNIRNQFDTILENYTENSSVQTNNDITNSFDN